MHAGACDHEYVGISLTVLFSFSLFVKYKNTCPLNICVKLSHCIDQDFGLHLYKLIYLFILDFIQLKAVTNLHFGFAPSCFTIGFIVFTSSTAYGRVRFTFFLLITL